ELREARHVCSAERVKGKSVCHVAHQFPQSSRGGDRLVDELEAIGVIVDGPVFASHGNDTAVANLENASLLPGREPLHTIPNVHRSSLRMSCHRRRASMASSMSWAVR